MPSSVMLRWSDAWLLTAIYYAAGSRAAPLTHILAASDLINHATLTIEELRSGLVRLEKAGLIAQAGTSLTFQCTPAARERIGLLKPASKALFDLWKALEASLGVAPWVPGEPAPHPDNVFSYPGLTESVFARALKSYLTPRATSRGPKKEHGRPNEPPA
ncbi:MAG: hypothetical protein WCP29_04970 [Acidobacteriota bacterium]